MKKVALITGSSGSIGSNIAKEFKKKGFSVFLTGTNVEKLKKISSQLDSPYKVYDLTEIENCEKLIKEVIKHYGRIDILVNNAGMYEYKKIEDIEKTLDIVKLNLVSAILLIKYASVYMKKQKWGRIVNIGSISGVMGESFASVYSATKAGLIGLTKSLGLELAQDNITVNTINPGWVETPLAYDSIKSGELTLDENIEIIPQKRFIHPNEVASLVLYLVSQKAKGITGQSINLCAGLSVGI